MVSSVFSFGAGVKVTLDDIAIEGFDVGIHSSGPIDLTARNLRFNNVRQPFDVQASSAAVTGTQIRNDPKLHRAYPKSKSGVGWSATLENGPPLPSFCPKCKATFASMNYRFSGPYFNLWGNEDVCTACGFEHAKLAEGVFDLTAEAAKIMLAPDFTYAMAASIGEIARSAVRKEVSLAEAESAIRKISAPVADVIRRAANIGPTAQFWINICLSVIAIYIALQGNDISREALNAPNAAMEYTFSQMSGVRIATEYLADAVVSTQSDRSIGTPTQGEPPLEPH